MLENLRKILTNDFEVALLEEAIKNLNSDSKIRFSNFAFVIRELIDVLLKNLANDQDIIQCNWYAEPQNIERRIVRAQRLRYIIQGGFIENIFDEILDRDFNSSIKKINSYFRDVLSNHVHLTEQSLNYTAIEVEQKTKEFELIIDHFLEMIMQVKQSIIEFLTDEIEQIVTDNFLSDTIDDLDILSTHTRIDSIDNVDIEIDSITFDKILGTITGNVNVSLQYGSDRDLRNGDGFEDEDSYPFALPFSINIQALNNLSKEYLEDKEYVLEEFILDFRNIMLDNINIDVNQANVDTNSFYE